MYFLILILIMIRRNINNVKILIDEKEANSIYFSNSFAGKLIDDSISTILDAIYNQKRIMVPLTVLFEITNKCNFKCPFCYIVNNKEKSEIKRFDEIKIILDNMINKGLLFCTLTGGECLLHPDFVKIYLYLKNHGVLVSILSNGSFINKEIIKLFKEYKPYKIEISLYGDNDYTFFNNTKQCKINLDIIFNNILKLKENGINVICKTPLNSVTENSFFIMKKWCENNSIPYYYSSELFDTYDGRDNSIYAIKNKSLICQLEKEELELLKLVDYRKGTKKYFDCKAGKYDLIITYDWYLLPCFLLKKNKDFLFPLSDGFDNAYNNLIKKVESYKNRKLEYCNGCKSYNICKECAATAIIGKDMDICHKNNILRKKVEGENKNEYI